MVRASCWESTVITLKGTLLRVDSISFLTLINKRHRHSPCSPYGQSMGVVHGLGVSVLSTDPGYKLPFFTFLEMQL